MRFAFNVSGTKPPQGSINTLAPSIYSEVLFPGGTYTFEPGLWTNNPTLFPRLQISIDDLNWEDAGPATGVFPTTAQEHYARVQIDAIVIGASDGVAYSPSIGPLGPAYDQVLGYTSGIGQMNCLFTPPFAGAALSGRPDAGFWVMTMYYYPGGQEVTTSSILGSVCAAAGGPIEAYFGPNNSSFFDGGNNGASAIESGLTSSGWNITTAFFYSPSGTNHASQIMTNDIIGTAGIGSNSVNLNNFDNLRVGGRTSTTTSAAASWPMCWVAWGTGNPVDAHLWAFNEGALRNIWDYPGFSTSCTISDYILLTKENPGNQIFNISEVYGRIGSDYDTWTLNGAKQWVNRLPGFINPAGDPPEVPVTYIHPRFGVVDDVYTFCQHGIFIGEAAPVNFTAWTLIHSTLGDISNTVVNGQFTCSTPGVITFSLTNSVTGTASGTVEIIQPAPLSSDTTFAGFYNGNGRAAGIQPYPATGAGTTFADAAALKLAIDALAPGATLTVNDMSDLANVLTLTAKDYGGVTVIAKNRHQVKVKSVVGASVVGLTLQGFWTVPKDIGLGTEQRGFIFRGVDKVVIDQCAGSQFVLTGKDKATSIGTVSNWPGHDDGSNTESQITNFDRAIARHVAIGNTSIYGQDILRTGTNNVTIFERVVLAECLESRPEYHTDAWQTLYSGSQGFSGGIALNCVVLDHQLGPYPHGVHGIFLTGLTNQDMRILNCLVDTVSAHGIDMSDMQQNCSVEKTTSQNFTMTATPASGYFDNCLTPAASCMAASGGPVLNTFVNTPYLTAYPNYDLFPLSWEGFTNPVAPYQTAGCYELIEELKANKIAYP